MKQCPTCSATFDDGDRFCEIDGTPLLPVRSSSPTSRKMVPVLAVIGVSLGALIAIVYLSFSGESSAPEPATNSTVAQQQPAPRVLPPPRSAVEPSPSPSVAPSPSPSAQVSPSPQPSVSMVELSSSPITTSTGAPSVRGQMIIHLVNGAKIEADEVWQTGEGIWYRKGSVMSLLDPKNVKSIDRLTPAAPSPTKAP
jgi:hypothetical protein